MYDGPIIDIHAHIAVSADDAMSETHAVGAAGLIAALRVEQVIRATAIVIARPDEPDLTAQRNDAVLATGADSDGFLIPVVSVHPGDGEAALAELDRVAARGARMLKLHPNTQAFDVADDAVGAVVRRAGANGMTVLFDGYSPFDANQPGKFLQLAVACPDTSLILAHLNGPNFAELLMFHLVARYPWWPGNVYHDLSATAELLADGPYVEHLRWVVRKIGVDRVLYGSDWPMCDPRSAINAARRLGFTEEEQRQIFHSNAVALLGL